jgi:hypothetical protein
MGFVVLCRKYTEKLWIDLKWIQQSIGQVLRHLKIHWYPKSSHLEILSEEDKDGSDARTSALYLAPASVLIFCVFKSPLMSPTETLLKLSLFLYQFTDAGTDA